jgi:hypothetical protein
MDGSQKRKPPRLNATSAVLKHAAKHGFDVHVITKPDGTVEYDLTKPKGDAADAENDEALTGDQARKHINSALEAIKNGGGRGGRRQG